MLSIGRHPHVHIHSFQFAYPTMSFSGSSTVGVAITFASVTGTVPKEDIDFKLNPETRAGRSNTTQTNIESFCKVNLNELCIKTHTFMVQNVGLNEVVRSEPAHKPAVLRPNLDTLKAGCAVVLSRFSCGLCRLCKHRHLLALCLGRGCWAIQSQLLQAAGTHWEPIVNHPACIRTSAEL